MRLTMKQARIGINATQRDIAEKLDIHPQTYMNIERHPERATIDQAQRFSQIVGLDLADIFFGVESTLSSNAIPIEGKS